MNHRGLLKRLFLALALLASAGSPAADADEPLLKLQAVPFSDVQIHDSFWSPRQEVNRTASMPLNLEMLERSGNIRNLELAAARATSGFTGPVFMDSDLHKALEAASYSLASHPDPALEKRIDEIVAKLAAAQLADGYLDSYYIVKEPGRRWTNLRDNHELYCAGHMIEAAVAHFRATGKTNFLTVATKLADHIDSVFGPWQAPGLSRTSRNRAGTHQALAGHRREALLRAGPLLHREPGPQVLRDRTPYSAWSVRRNLLAR